MTLITLDVLPATRGDGLWLECQRPGQRPWRMLCDGGLPTDYPLLREHIRRMVPNGPVEIDLLVISHVDSDHIGGLLSLLTDPDLDLSLGDLWFNGLPQLPEVEDRASRSVAEGEQLLALLGDRANGKRLPWNERFGRAAVATLGDGSFHVIDWPDGPRLTLLSPTPRRLKALRKTWTAELLKLQRGEPSQEEPTAVPQALEDLEALARQPTSLDASAANGSSIAFLLEYANHRLLFAADAFSSVLGPALTALANSRDGEPIKVDIFKLPHHGSKGNVTAALLGLVPARHYVISTNGERFNHPDDVALARVVTQPRPDGQAVTLWFNYASTAAQRWDRPDLRERYGFAVQMPGALASPGIRLQLPDPPSCERDPS